MSLGLGNAGHGLLIRKLPHFAIKLSFIPAIDEERVCKFQKIILDFNLSVSERRWKY